MPRDLTAQQFDAALAEHGFARTPGGPWFHHRDEPGVHYGGIVDAKTFRLRHRATLAKLLEARARRARGRPF